MLDLKDVTINCWLKAAGALYRKIGEMMKTERMALYFCLKKCKDYKI